MLFPPGLLWVNLAVKSNIICLDTKLLGEISGGRKNVSPKYLANSSTIEGYVLLASLISY